MTTYKIKTKNDEAIIEISGHAAYADYGSDIVCAAISTACIYTANLIERLKLGYNVIDLVCEEGYFRLQVKLSDATCLAIFENLKFLLDDIANQYPQNLKLEK